MSTDCQVTSAFSQTENARQRTRPVVLHTRVVTATGGGPDKTILNSPRFLEQLNYASKCVYFRPPGDEGFSVLRSRAKDWSAELIEIDDRGKLDLKAIKQAVRLCREHQVSIWHAHDYKTNLIGLIASRYHPMKLVTTAHGWVNFSGQTPLYYWLDKRWWLRRYDRVICVSSTVLDECMKAGVPRSKCILIENAIDQEQFSRARPIADAKRDLFDASDDQLVIGAIGRLAGEKGFDLLIQAFQRIVAMGVNAKLVIAGEGPDESQLASQIAASGIADRIQLLGFCSNTRAFYEAMDVFVLSSLREGLPNTLLEAMSVGAPVIATRVGGVERVVRDSVNGLVIDPESVDQIVAGLQTLCGDADQRARLAEAGVRTIAEDWSFRNRMSKIAEIYDGLLGRRDSALGMDGP